MYAQDKMTKILMKKITTILMAFIMSLFFYGNVWAQADDSIDESEINDEVVTQASDPLQTNGEYRLYYTNICPHCSKVKSYIKKYNLSDKIVMKELTSDQTAPNSIEFDSIFDYLGVDENERGVPLLVHDGVYKNDANAIMDYLQTEFNVNESDIDPAIIVLGSFAGILVIGIVVYKFVLK